MIEFDFTRLSLSVWQLGQFQVVRFFTPRLAIFLLIRQWYYTFETVNVIADV